MIIYKETIEDFIRDCDNNQIVAMIKKCLIERRGWVASPKEEQSWNTLKVVSKDLEKLEEKDKQYILLEYVIRDTRKRIDVILIGKDKRGNKNLAIIELKGWSKIDLYGDTNLLNPHVSYGIQNHPSTEANDYRYILENMYSEVSNEFKLYSYSYLPNYLPEKTNVLLDRRFNNILKHSYAYCKEDSDEFVKELLDKFEKQINQKEVEFLNDLTYKPTLTFKEHMERECEEIRLLGSQNVAYERFKYYIKTLKSEKKRTLFLVSGGAGSGKTIVALKMMIYLRSKGMKSNMIIPGPEFREAIKKMNHKFAAEEFIIGANYNKKYEYVIIDEAHKATGRDSAYIFYSRILKNISSVAVALIDNKQVVNKKGITKDQLKELASKNNYDIVEFDLQEQFRNGGDVSYINWLNHMLYNEDNGQETFINNFYDFEVLDDIPFNERYRRMYDTHNVRLVSFWTQTWDLDSLDPNVKIGSFKYTWNPNWRWLDKYQKNHKVSKEIINLSTKKNFILDKKGCQYIGYFNTVQGNEFEYIFVHVPRLFYLNNRGEIDVNIDELDMTEMSTQVWSTKSIKSKKEKEEKMRLNKTYFINRLFVNLTRGTKGTYVYIEDEKLRDYFKNAYRKVTN